MTAIEQSQANGRAEQHVPALRERLRIMVEDATRRDADFITRSSCCKVGNGEWIQNFLGNDVDLGGGGIKITPQCGDLRI